MAGDEDHACEVDPVGEFEQDPKPDRIALFLGGEEDEHRPRTLQKPCQPFGLLVSEGENSGAGEQQGRAIAGLAGSEKLLLDFAGLPRVCFRQQRFEPGSFGVIAAFLLDYDLETGAFSQFIEAHTQASH